MTRQGISRQSCNNWWDLLIVMDLSLVLKKINDSTFKQLSAISNEVK